MTLPTMDPTQNQPSNGSGNGQSQSLDFSQLFSDPKFQSVLSEAVTKATQSTKDKRISGLENKVKDMGATLKAYEAYRAQGLSVEAAEKQMKIDEILAERSGAGEAASQNSVHADDKKQESTQADVVDSLLTSLGLDKSDEVRSLISGKAIPDAVQEIMNVYQKSNPAGKTFTDTKGNLPDKQETPETLMAEYKSLEASRDAQSMARKQAIVEKAVLLSKKV